MLKTFSLSPTKWCRFSVPRNSFRKFRHRLRSSSGEGSLPYQYDQQELQELLDMMPPPLEAETLPSSDVKFKRLLDKYGLQTEALFGTDFEDRVEEQERKRAQQADLDSAPWLRDPLWEETPLEEEESEQKKKELTEEEEELLASAEFANQCRKDFEYEQIFLKAMELHHSQRARARNIYAACLWYAEKLKEADTEDYFEGHRESPIPAYIRAFFTLEEDFDELNEKQYEVELKKQERTRAIQDEEYREFLRNKVINMPTRAGSELDKIFQTFEKEKEKPKELKEPDNVDYLMKGILPHVDEESLIGPESETKEKDIDDLIFEDVRSASDYQL